MASADQDTIYALSSGQLPSGVAIIRVSGPRVRFVIETIIQKKLKARKAERITIIDPHSLEILDDGLGLFFPGPESFTGEDVLEIQCHGSRAVVEALLGFLGGFSGVRAAERGEFTRRAFNNEKMSLLGVEGLSDLIAAETRAQLDLARAQTDGGMDKTFEGWRMDLIRLRGLIEAELDFPDEEDVPGSVSDVVWKNVTTLKSEMQDALKGSAIAERVRDGISVVLVGEPNAGKSTLMNALAGRDVAIVSDIPGTTRDVLEVHMDLDGLAVKISDTAGFRKTSDAIEKIGVERAKSALNKADIVLQLHALDKETCESVGLEGYDADPRLMMVGTKKDLIKDKDVILDRCFDYVISAKTEDGLSGLLEGISSRAKNLTDGRETLIIARARHTDAIKEAIADLEFSLDDAKPLEIRAEFLRSCSEKIGRIVGKTDADDILDVVFREFCIGK